jgi:flagellar basal body rod protein FlgF
LTEANKNAKKLAEIAEEMANAKESTDGFVAELTEAMEVLWEDIHNRETQLYELNDQIETYQF